MLCLVGVLFLAQAEALSYILLTLPAVHLFKQVQGWYIYKPESSLKTFKSNRNFGLLVLLSFAVMDIDILNMDFVNNLISTLQNLL